MRLDWENRWIRRGLRCLAGMAATAAAVWLRLLLVPIVGPTSPYLTVYPAVMFVAFFLGTGPGIAAGLLGIWLVELHVIDPDGTQPSEVADWLRASIVLFSAAFLGYAGHRVQAAYRRIFHLLESISDAFISVDGNWRFAYINGEAERLLGQPRDALLGKPLWAAYPGAAGETLRPRLEQAVTEQKPSRFEVFLPASGAWHEMHARPTRHGLSLYFRDVTQRKTADQALRRNEEKYRSLFETIDEGFCIIEVLFDERDRARDYRFLEVNPAFEKQTGLADAVGRTIRELVPGHERYWFEIYGRIAQTGVPERFENRAQALGRFYDVYAFRLGAAEQRQVAVLFTDVTERKRREANLAFLAEIAEDLSRLTSADKIAEQLGAKIGAYLQVETCSFCEVDEGRDELTVLFGWQQAGASSLPGTLRMSEYCGEEFQLASRLRKTIAVGDTQSDPRTRARAFAELNIRSLLSAPFLKQGRWKYSLMGTAAQARQWRQDELELFQELASRIFPRIERALAEEAQRQAVERYERQVRLFEGIASTTPDFVHVLDTRGRFQYANRRLLEVWGMTLPEALGKTCLELGYEQWHHDMHMREIAEVIATKRPIKGEVPFRAPRTGVFGIYEYIFTPVLGPDGEVELIAGTIRDVTDRRRADDAARELQRKLDSALLAGEVATFEWRVPEDRLWGDQNFARLFGIRMDSSGGAPLAEYLEAIHPDDRADVIEHVNRTVASGCPYEAEYRIVTGGQTRWVVARGMGERDEAGRVVRFPGVIVDITDRKLSEEALRQSEARYRESQRRFQEVLENSLDAAYRRDLRTDSYDYVSPVVRQVFNIDPEVLRSLPVAGLLERIHPDDRQTVGRAIEEGTAAGSGRVEYRFRGDDGQYRWLADHFTVQRDAAGRPVSRGGIVREITELRKAQEALKEADRRKDEFLAMLGHELRNPLAAITTGLRLLRTADAPRQAWVRESLERQTRQLVRLVDDLLDVSRITRGKIQLQPEFVDLRQVVERAAESTADLMAEKRHSFTVRGPEEPLGVLGDATRLQQVIANLLSNAAKYTDEGGRIELCLAREQELAVIQVTDNGSGIPPELQQSIFELFGQVDSTLHSSQQGLGIGLHLVKTLVELHGGNVHVHSAGRGAGCEFTVRLPLAEPPDDLRAEHRPDASSETRLEILLVEDNKEAARLLGTELTDRGHRVRVAGDGRAALELARVQQPDLVILDIGLPDMSGYEVAEKLREDQGRRDILIVAASGYGQERDRQRSREAGIDYHLVKPLEYDTLASLVREWLRTAYDRRREIARRSQSQRHTARPPAARILIIDDTPIIAEMTQEVLQSAGHEVQVAFDGCSGLQTAREFRPDLILCDISMPGMNGYQVVRALIEDGGCPHTTFVAVSGYGDEAAQQRSREAGFHAHLVKPVSADALDELIRGLPAASRSQS